MSAQNNSDLRFALVVTIVLAAFLGMVSYAAAGKVINSDKFFIWAGISVVISLLVFYKLTSRLRKRKKLYKEAFPAEWENILNEYVDFYRNLGPDEQEQFKYEIRVFIEEKRINGIKTEINDTDRILVAASAIIPIFGFRGWEYNNLNEVLLYPKTFSQNYEIEKGKDRNVQGMVGSGFMNGMMILSKPDLHYSFKLGSDRHNVGIHEFVHLLDKADGNVDGIPETLLGREYAVPWLELVRTEIQKIRKGKSDINPYGSLSKEEFFAVASEYFFERPELMEEKHPQLYKMLRKIFRQDISARFRNAVKRIFKRRKAGELGRNSPCPCGSGKKYKKCCGSSLRNAA